MDTGKEIIDLTKAVLANAKKIDDIIDTALDPIKDYTDTLGDLIAPAKSFISIVNLKRRLTLKAFLKNYAHQLYGNFVINDAETIKLQAFFKNERNLIFVAETIDNAIHAKSLKASAILGVVAGKLIKDKKNLTENDFSIIESLRTMTDVDLQNFTVLYEYIHATGTGHDQTDEYRTRDFYDSETEVKLHLDRISVEHTIEKLKRSNGLTYNDGGISMSGNAKGCFEFNDVSGELYQLIKRTQVVA